MIDLIRKYLPIIKNYTPVGVGIYLLGWVHFGFVTKMPKASVVIFVVCIALFIIATRSDKK